MGYTKIEEERFHYTRKEENLGLKDACIRFIHDSCEGLRFKKDEDDDYSGKSIKQNQIRFNMEKDIDRRCLEVAMDRFLDSGAKEDAFDVYFCYMEMFFGGYGKSQGFIELLSEFETNGSKLLMKHRDHFVHSVYVFALGLAIYETNHEYRETYANFYNLPSNTKEAAHHFVQYWGLTSLFHDIGYPFELPFEQCVSYFEISEKIAANRKNKKPELDRDKLKMPILSYKGIDQFIAFGKEVEGFGYKFKNSNTLLSYGIAKRIGEEYGKTQAEIYEALQTKASSPDVYNYYMDHAFFSATMLVQEMVKEKESLSDEEIDALTAIILHNSLFKFLITNYKKVYHPFSAKIHPLAYMLMLCDELQCWDRTSYGRESQNQLHPMDCKFVFEENQITATYIYDEDENNKIDVFNEKYKDYEANGKTGKEPKLKAYSTMVNENKFKSDIERIVELKDISASLNVNTDNRSRDKFKKRNYLSECDFIHLYNFAMVLNARYNSKASKEEMESQFEELSLEYKMSNIGQAKAFAEYLHEIKCFYTDRPVVFNQLKKFEKKDLDIIGPLEHERWLREHEAMGWIFGEEYVKDGTEDKIMREQKRMHKLMMDGEINRENARDHYNNELSDEDKGKDTEPMNCMLKLLQEFHGLRIYQLDIKQEKE